MKIDQRLTRLERRVVAPDYWTRCLPEGVTVAEAEAALETWAQLAADYARRFDVDEVTAGDATYDAWAALLRSGATLGDDDDDEI